MNKRHRDTSQGGPNDQFPETTWSMISRLRKSHADLRRPGLEKLSRRYWKPVYQYVRCAWAKSNEDAKDLTQTFFVWLLEGGEVLKKYEPERGGFRHYLKGLLRNFMADQRKALGRIKRGGGVRVFPLDDDLMALKELVPDSKASDPDRVFDAAWKKQILDAALARVREDFKEGDRAVQFRVFEEYDLSSPDARPTYADVAAKLGIKESDVRNHLFAVREKLRAEIRAELAETVTDSRELQDEWNALFA
ncbi:MAG: sigma-70 family RNA polymerase sigma factor [Planctomycetes bacterium]|nr:sigma-70 family RNA polymerase sigma factor [Planctomycetota bacterium]